VTDTDFPARLRALRERAGLTAAQLAAAAGLHRTHYYKVERGDRAPTWETVRKLAAALGVKTEAFR
jgi:transcriptional regulator with XRE-family HTH domain